MNIVVPMAGLGSRFAEAGFTTPKPLIPVEGRPMYAWAVESLPLRHSTRLIFVLLRTMPSYQELREDIEERYATFDPLVLDVPELTRGQSETVLRARPQIDNATPLLIHNADTAFAIAEDWGAKAIGEELDGALVVFKSDESRWSYSRENEEGYVTEVKEKVVISPWATTGAYYFGRGSEFVALADAAIAGGETEKGEYYVGPLYNKIATRGGRIRNYVADELYCFGTPEDLQATLAKLPA
ncbi:MAG: glycosyltransferase family 2 protein [Verrucomicrobiota bacterium]